jgi:hypothetical protein
MIGPAFEACREMQYRPSGAGELTRRRSLTHLVGNFSVILGAGVARLASGSPIDSLVERNRKARELAKLRRGLWLITERLDRS